MSMTRGQLLDRVQAVIGDTSTKFRTYLAGSLDNELHKLWDRHDWEFKHKTGSFNTVIGTEQYDLSVSTPSLRSTSHLELMYDKTNGSIIRKTDFKTIRKNYPDEDTSGSPTAYAPWGNNIIYLNPKADGIYEIKYLFASKAVVPTDDADDLYTVCGLPDFAQPVLEELVLSKGLFYTDDGRYNALRVEIENVLIPRLIQADQQALEQTARFKFYNEDLNFTDSTYDQFIDRVYGGGWSD